MNPKTRISFFVLLIGCAITVGVVIEGITPLTVLHEESEIIPSNSYGNVLKRTLLYAKNYRLVVQVREGDPVDVVFFQIDGVFWREYNMTLGFTEMNIIPIRGIYNCTIFNDGLTSSTVRVSLALFGPDYQTLLLGYVIFWSGFFLSIVCVVYDSKKAV